MNGDYGIVLGSSGVVYLPRDGPWDRSAAEDHLKILQRSKPWNFKGARVQKVSDKEFDYVHYLPETRQGDIALTLTDIEGENVAIRQYTDHINYPGIPEKHKKVLKHIRSEEEHHKKELEKLVE